MSRLAEEAKAIYEAFEILLNACENIKEYDQCGECPMRYMCIEETDESLATIAELKSPSSWQEFLEYSENAEFSKADRDAQYADFMRKYELEERMIDGYDG